MTEKSIQPSAISIQLQTFSWNK